MQSSVPELTDTSEEPASTWEMYGEDATKPGSFAQTCLMARRLAERGVRFVQVYHRGWDVHGNLPEVLPSQCKEIDQPCWALVQDLKQRGMLDDTLVDSGRRVRPDHLFTRQTYRRQTMAAIIIRGASVCGWRAVASRAALSTAKLTNSATTSRRIPFTFAIFRPRSCTSSESITNGFPTSTRDWMWSGPLN